MIAIKSLSAQVREARRLSGMRVTLRADRLKVKDPSGTLSEKRIMLANVDEDYVKRFVDEVFRTYVFRTLAGGCDYRVGESDIVHTGPAVEWTRDELTFTAWVRPYPHCDIEVRVANSEGFMLDRPSFNIWMDPLKLEAFLVDLVSDYRELLRLRVYLSTQDASLRFCHGTRIAGTIHVVFLHGKMVMSCWDESDFPKIRRALDILDGYHRWSMPPETPASPEPMEVTLELA
jgi:hypothetical protein